MRLEQNATLVEMCGSALRRTDHGLDTVPKLIKRILREEAWREFITQRGEHVVHERFVDFVEAPLLRGIGGTVDLVRRIVADDPEALDLLDQALQNPVGTNVPLDNVQAHPSGNSQSAALRRLRKDAPELHAEVLAGRLSAHAAMVRAGFRRRTFSVPADAQAEAIIAALRRNLPPDRFAEVVRALSSS